MPTIKVSQFRVAQFGSAPYGNLSVLPFQLKTNAAGAVVNSDTATGIASGDKVVLGSLPAGMRLDNSSVIVSTALSALVTGSLGFEYEDGIDVPSTPQDAAYFGAGINLNTAARVPNTSSKALVTLPKPAFLILTTAGAANAKVGLVDVVITGEMTGPR